MLRIPLASIAALPLGIAGLGAPGGLAERPALTIDQASVRPTTVLEVFLVSPEGPQVLAPLRRFRSDPDWTPDDALPLGERTKIECAYLDSSHGDDFWVGPGKLEPTAGTHRARVTVDRRRPVGLLGYSFQHGFVERVVTPKMMEGREHLAIELALPAARASGTLDFEFSFGFDRSFADPERLSLMGPVTGCVVNGIDIGKGESSGSLAAAPGAYVVSLWPRNENSALCYGLRPRVPAGVALRDKVTVRPLESTAISHAFDRVGGLSLQVNVPSRMGEVERGLKPLMKSLPGSMHSAFDELVLEEPPSLPPGWHFSAKLHPRDQGSAWTSRSLTFAWSESTKEYGAPVAPLGAHLWSLDRVPPGEYVIELSGDWIETTSQGIVVEDDADWLWKTEPSIVLEVQPKGSRR